MNLSSIAFNCDICHKNVPPALTSHSLLSKVYYSIHSSTCNFAFCVLWWFQRTNATRCFKPLEKCTISWAPNLNEMVLRRTWFERNYETRTDIFANESVSIFAWHRIMEKKTAKESPAIRTWHEDDNSNVNITIEQVELIVYLKIPSGCF